jgi:hypothetical protein
LFTPTIEKIIFLSSLMNRVVVSAKIKEVALFRKPNLPILNY